MEQIYLKKHMKQYCRSRRCRINQPLQSLRKNLKPGYNISLADKAVLKGTSYSPKMHNLLAFLNKNVCPLKCSLLCNYSSNMHLKIEGNYV